MGLCADIMKGVSRNLIPELREVNDGPPVARIIPFGAAIMASVLVVAYFLGLPTASGRVAPMFFLPIVFLASKHRHLVATGYALLAIGCIMRGVSAFWVANFTAGQVLSSLAGWGWMAWNFTLMAMMVMARGIRHSGVLS